MRFAGHSPVPEFDHESELRLRFRCPGCARGLEIVQVNLESGGGDELLAVCRGCNLVVTRAVWNLVRDTSSAVG